MPVFLSVKAQKCCQYMVSQLIWKMLPNLTLFHMEAYIEECSCWTIFYSKTASLVSIRNLHSGKNAFTKLCSCWTKKDPLLMRHPPLGFFIALHYWEPLCACLLNRLNLLGLKCSGPLASKSKTCSEACSCPAPATLQHNISPGVLQKK